MAKIKPQLKNTQIRLIEKLVRKGRYRKTIAERLGIPLNIFKRRIKETKLIDSDIFQSRGKPNKDFHSYLDNSATEDTRKRVSKHRLKNKKKILQKAVLDTKNNSIRQRKKCINGLNAKDRLFVKHYVTNLDAEKAVIEAKYKIKNPESYGRKLLKRPEIILAVQKEFKKVCNRIEITQDDVLKKYIDIAFGNLKQFVIDKEVPIKRKGKETGRTKTVKVFATTAEEISNLSDEDAYLINKIKKTKEGDQLELIDKTKALEILSRFTGLLDNKLNVNVSGEVTHKYEPDYSKLSTEELLKLEELLDKAKPAELPDIETEATVVSEDN